MLRRIPLRRKTWLRGRSQTSSYRRRPRAFAFMSFVKTLPCAAFELGTCWGRIEADHAGRRGIGQKADDRTCIPLCTKHHRERTGFCGDFKGWTQEQMRAWLIERIAVTQLTAALNNISLEAA